MAAKDNQINLLPGKSLDGTMLPDMSYLDNIRKIAQGDLSSALTGGDKLIALSGLLRSVARGSRTTPQEAMAQVQQAALGRASTQMQLAQLQAAAEAKAKREATLAAFANTLPEEKRQTFLALPAEEQNKMLSENVNPTPFQMKEVNGKTYMVFRSGDKKEIDLPTDVKGVFQEIDYNKDGIAEKVFVDERTGQPILNAQGQPLIYGLGMTPAQRDASARGWADYGLDVKKFNRGDGAGGGSGGGKEQQIWVGGTGGKPVKTLAYRDKSSPTGWRQYGTNMVVRRMPSPTGQGDDIEGLIRQLKGE